MEHIEVDGLRIGFEQSGHGPPLVLLHGLPGDSRQWRGQLDDLADEYTVVAWDAPGCGQSSDPSDAFGLSDVARYLTGFINSLGQEHPHVLGLSWGGGLALEPYRREPTAPRTLVLASADAGWAGSLPEDAVAQRLDAYLTAARTPPQEAMRSWGPGLFSESVPAEIDLRGMLPSIEVPTLLLYGDADTRAPLYLAEELHSRIPGATLVVLPGVGHVSNVEAPDRFNTEVRKFLRSQPS